MDPMSLAALASPILAKGAEAFSQAAGEKLGGKIDQLTQVVVNKFKGDSFAEETLSRAKELPDSEKRQGALEDILVEKMEEDVAFADRLAKLTEEMRNESARANFDQRGQTVYGPQTNIVGDVKCQVLTGRSTD